MATISFDDLQSGRAFEHWATQSQMDALIRNTEGLPRVAGFFAELASAAKRTNNINDAILQASKRNASSNTQQTRIAEETLKEEKKQTRESTQNTRSLGMASKALVQTANSFMTAKPGAGGFFGALATAADRASGMLGNMGGAQGGAGRANAALGVLGAVAGATGASLRALGAFLDDEIKLRATLQERGFTIADNFLQISTAALELGLGFNELEKVVERGRYFFAAMGGTVENGTRQFLGMFSQVQGAMQPFGNFGMSPGETAELFQAYIDNQVASGQNFADLNRRMDEVVGNFVQLNKETAAVAALTGTRREELLQARFRAQNDNALRAQLINMRATGQGDAASRIEQNVGAAASAMAPVANTEIGRMMLNNMVQQQAFLLQGRGYTMGPEAARLEMLLNQADQSGELAQQYRRIVESASQEGVSSADITRQMGELINTVIGSSGRIASLSGTAGARSALGDPLAEFLNAASRARGLGANGAFDDMLNRINGEGLDENNTLIRDNNIALNNLNTTMAQLTGRIQSGYREGMMNTVSGNMLGFNGIGYLNEQLGATGTAMQGLGYGTGVATAIPGTATLYGGAGAIDIVSGIGALAAALMGAGTPEGQDPSTPPVGGSSLADIMRELQTLNRNMITFSNRFGSP